MKEKAYKDMPLPARVISGTIGLSLLLGVLLMVLTIRPWNWQVIGLAVAGLGLGADLLAGALLSRWPASALVWLDLAFGQ
jgi:hypothetical protein